MKVSIRIKPYQLMSNVSPAPPPPPPGKVYGLEDIGLSLIVFVR